MVICACKVGISIAFPRRQRIGTGRRYTSTKERHLSPKPSRAGAGRVLLVYASDTTPSQKQDKVQSAVSKNIKPNPKEKEALAAFLESAGDVAAAKSILREAAVTKKTKPFRVVGAMAFLEQQTQQASAASYLPKLNGRWQLVFSSPSAIEAWQYIPVDEDMVIDSAKSSILLTSDLGPLYTQFGGTFSYDGPANVMEWGFTELQVKLFGRVLLERALDMSRKTYTYFAYDDDVVAARSSGGFLTLLRRKAD